MKVESEKVGLKLNIQKSKIIASGLITSWEIQSEAEGKPGMIRFDREKSLLLV